MHIPAFLLAALSFVYPQLPVVVDPPTKTLVSLRIEGQYKTLFDGPVYTWPHDVTTKKGGKHHCDGTNANGSTTPGPTVTGTLDNAASASGFTWDGPFYSGMDDYLVDLISLESSSNALYWASILNYKKTDLGGCQVKVKQNDEVVWAHLTYTPPFLKLDGPTTAQVNQTVVVTVTDGSTGKPIAEAVIGNKKSDAKGQASFIFPKAGVERLKAEKDYTLRSKTLEITVK